MLKKLLSVFDKKCRTKKMYFLAESSKNKIRIFFLNGRCFFVFRVLGSNDSGKKNTFFFTCSNSMDKNTKMYPKMFSTSLYLLRGGNNPPPPE